MKNRENAHNSRFLTVQQVAEQLLVEAKSVRRWLKIGKLKGYKLPGGDWRIRADDVEEILKAAPVKAPDEEPGQVRHLLRTVPRTEVGEELCE